MATKKRSKGPAYKRVLLKFSGEALQNRKTGECLDAEVLEQAAAQVRQAYDMGCQVGIVVGGGNIFRGLPGAGAGIDRATGDNMGMLATVINSLALQSAIERAGIPARVMSAIPMTSVAEPFVRRRAVHHLEHGRVVIFGAGTGNPYFTTDSAAALRASEIHANVLLKATKVDGIYDSDPMKNPKAKRFREITYAEALNRRLKIMDAAAFSLCMENRIPIIVFNFFRQGEILRVLRNKPVGTLVHE